MAELSLKARIRGAAARMLGRLPFPVQRALSGGRPIRVDGQTLDPTLQLFLALRPRGERRPLTGGSPEQARARHREEILALRGGSTPVGEVREMEIPGAAGRLRARLYVPPGGEDAPSLLVYFHGGGYTIGDLDTADETCRMLSVHGGQRVLNVEYRLAPEHPLPAALDDALAAYQWARANAAALGVAPHRVAVGGDSAGGELAAAVSQLAADAPPLAQLLIYPPTDRTTERPSAALFDGYFLSVADRDTFSAYYYLSTGTPDDDPRISPLLAPELGGLPPALVVNAGFDVLRDEGRAYAEALRAAGTPCEMHEEPSLAHGFVQMTPASRTSYEAMIRVARRWRELLATHTRP